MRFSKYHGCGNDFLMCLEKPNQPESFAIEYCDRHTGIGADGVMWIEKSNHADIKMKYINSDGSPAKMCGNGLRCFVRFALDEKIINKHEFIVETDAGNIAVKFDEKTKWIDLSLMLPRSLNDTETLCPGDIIDWNNEDTSLKIHTLHLGTLHAVVFVNNYTEIEKLGPMITSDECFPQDINVNFVKIHSKEKIEVRTHERGAGWTLACGTGISASAYVAIKQQLVSSHVHVVAPGGSCEVTLANDCIHLFGPAKKIADIEIGD